MNSSRSSRSSSPVEERNILKNWEPEPLVGEVDAESNKHILNPHIITSKSGRYMKIDGVNCRNFATHNYLGLADDPRLEEAAVEATKKYGCGSCGPRGFYGTMDVHLRLEEELARSLNVQEAVLYSFGFATIASAIPAYAKSSDVIFVDEYCNFAIQQGIIAARSQVIKFRHNDMRHLRELIEEFMNEQLEKYGKTNKIRTFIIVEGIYSKTGDLCPLKRLIELKCKHKIRLFIDESISFGSLGRTGKGITEHFDVDINDVDLIMGSLEGALCGYGGFCAGSMYIIDHQRLAGTGYCFSASLPPFQARVALESLRIISQQPEVIMKAQIQFKHAHQIFARLTLLNNISDLQSPVKILVLKGNYQKSREADEKYLNALCDKILLERRTVITMARHLEEEEMTRPMPSIRIAISGCHDDMEIYLLFRAIEEIADELMWKEKKCRQEHPEQASEGLS